MTTDKRTDVWSRDLQYEKSILGCGQWSGQDCEMKGSGAQNKGKQKSQNFWKVSFMGEKAGFFTAKNLSVNT